MDKQKKNIIQLVVLIIILIIVIIFAVKILNKNNKKQENENISTEGRTGIDVNDPAYEGMKIHKENGDTIIEGKDGSKTIETTKTKDNTGLKETTKEEKEKYEISNVKVTGKGAGTIITGEVTNNDNKKHTLIINIKFYSEDKKIKGSTSTKLEIEAENTKNFSMSIMEEVSQYKYNIEVEYAK